MSVSETMEAVPVMLGVSTLREVSAVSVMMDSVGMAMSVEVCHPLPIATWLHLTLQQCIHCSSFLAVVIRTFEKLITVLNFLHH